jgi:hypothetical protein
MARKLADVPARAPARAPMPYFPASFKREEPDPIVLDLVTMVDPHGPDAQAFGFAGQDGIDYWSVDNEDSAGRLPHERDPSIIPPPRFGSAARHPLIYGHDELIVLVPEETDMQTTTTVGGSVPTTPAVGDEPIVPTVSDELGLARANPFPEGGVEERTCERPGCDNTFTVPLKGSKRLRKYCGEVECTKKREADRMQGKRTAPAPAPVAGDREAFLASLRADRERLFEEITRVEAAIAAVEALS